MPSVQKGDQEWGAAAKEVAIPLLILALAAFVYGFLYGFDGVLLRDYSIYLYSGQRVAEGVPPYVGVFDHKGPFSPLLAGAGVLLSKELGFFLDDVYSVRVLFFLAGSLAVVAIYLLGKSAFGSRAAGIFAALTFLGFYAYAQPVASGPEPKTPMVLFEALSLAFSTNKRWFWGAFFGCLASLVWQPMAIFFLVTLVLALSRPKEERLNAALKALAGIALPLMATLAYFYYYGALGDFMDGFFLFNVEYLVRGQQGGWPLSELGGMVAVISVAYGTMAVPIVVGLINILRLYFLRPFRYRYAPLLLSFPAPLLWSLKDFQLADDFFVFLPYVAVGFGAFLASMMASLSRRSEAKRRLLALLFGVLLIGVALANTSEEVISAGAAKELKGTQIDLPQQREGALEIEKRLGGEEAKLASIGSPQALVLLDKKNPNPYPWITAGVDNEIEVREVGGFEGWVEGLKEAAPDGITFFGEGQSLMFTTHLTSEHAKELNDFLNSYYHVEKIGPWWLYVRGPK